MLSFQRISYKNQLNLKQYLWEPTVVVGDFDGLGVIFSGAALE
jgi:hypothetical protein